MKYTPMHSHDRPLIRRRPFTLLEILIVVSLIFILAGMLLAVMGPVKRHIRDTKSKAQIKQFQLMFESYYQDWGYYPQQGSPGILTAEFFSSLRTSDQGTPLFKVEDFDFDHADSDSDPADFELIYRPVNGHSQPFYYQSPGTVHPESYDIWCAGFDGLFGGNSVASVAGSASDPTASQDIDARPEDANDDIANWKRLQ